MMATVPHVTSCLGLRKFQADGFLLTRMYSKKNLRPFPEIDRSPTPFTLARIKFDLFTICNDYFVINTGLFLTNKWQNISKLIM